MLSTKYYEISWCFTGGTGSFAKEFILSLIKKKMANKIIVFSRDNLSSLS